MMGGSNTESQLRELHCVCPSFGNCRIAGYTTITWLNASLSAAAI